MNQHLMIDLETLGTTPDCVVLSLGACFFTASGIGVHEEWILNVQAQVDAGRKVSAQTLNWWMNQKPEAKQVIASSCNEQQSVWQAMNDFVGWVGKNCDPTKVRVWSCGANFDTIILEHLLRQVKVPVPWHFVNVRCYRTLKSMQRCEDGIAREGLAHKAVDDAIHQARCASAYLLKNVETDR